MNTTLIKVTPHLAIKCENQQLYGSYKVRGVRYLLDQLSSRPRQIVTASAGNMARALAEEARFYKIPVKVYLPDSAPHLKKSALKTLGCQIEEKKFLDIWHFVEDQKVEDEGLFVHPLLPQLLYGYGDLVDEILQEHPQTEMIVVPYGCGGLTLGLTRRLQALRANVQVVAAESCHAMPLASALKNKRPTSVTRTPSFIDAIGTPIVLDQAFADLQQRNISAGVSTLIETQKAIAFLYDRFQQKVEGAAAVAFSVGRKIAETTGLRTVAILTGGHIDPSVFAQICQKFATTQTARPDLCLSLRDPIQ